MPEARLPRVDRDALCHRLRGGRGPRLVPYVARGPTTGSPPPPWTLNSSSTS